MAACSSIIDSKVRVWKKIVCFYALTMLFSLSFGAFIVHAGKLDAGNLLYVTGAMWSPGLAAFATKKIFGEDIRDLPWRWPAMRWAWLAYLIPIGYALPVYLVVWLTGLGAFNLSMLPKIATDFGWKHLPPVLTLFLFVLITATLGMIGRVSRALGEEIGWRGFLVPELSKVVGFPGIGLISGLMWAAYHYPVLLFADYNAGAPAWYGLTCFTIMAVSGSFIMAWMTLRARSLWPAVILHASHNLFIQSILTPLTKDTGPTKFITDEFGIGLVITVTVALIIVLVIRKSSKKANGDLTLAASGQLRHVAGENK